MKKHKKNLRFFKVLSILLIFLLLDLQILPLFMKVFSQERKSKEVAIFIFPKDKKDFQSALLLKGLFRSQLKRLENVNRSDVCFIPNRENVQEVEKIHEEGKKYLSSLNGVKGEDIYKKGIDLILQTPGGIAKELIAKICKGYGISLILNGKIDEGKKMIKRSLFLYKKQRSSEYAYKVEVKNIFVQVVQDIENLPAGNVKVNSAPDNAEVFIDGEFKGFTPLTITNLPVGEHYIMILLDGYVSFAQFVDVPSMGTYTLNAVLIEAPQYEDFIPLISKIEKKIRARQEPKELATIKDLLGVSDVLSFIATERKGKYDLEGFYINEERSIKKLSFSIVQDASLLDNIRSFLASNLRTEIIAEKEITPLESPVMGEFEAGVPLPGGEEEYVIDPNSPLFKVPKKKKEEKGIFSKWWFWTIVGVVVGGGTTGLILLMKGEEGEKAPVGDVVIKLHTL